MLHVLLNLFIFKNPLLIWERTFVLEAILLLSGLHGFSSLTGPFSLCVSKMASSWLPHMWPVTCFLRHSTVAVLTVMLLLYFFLLIHFTKFSECLSCSSVLWALEREQAIKEESICSMCVKLTDFNGFSLLILSFLCHSLKIENPSEISSFLLISFSMC